MTHREVWRRAIAVLRDPLGLRAIRAELVNITKVLNAHQAGLQNHYTGLITHERLLKQHERTFRRMTPDEQRRFDRLMAAQDRKAKEFAQQVASAPPPDAA